MKILISAAETSSDLHGAKLLQALTRECESRGEKLDAFGIGGPQLKSAGLRIIVDAKELLSMGFTEILGRLPRILRSLSEIARTASREKPDVAVVIDYPDFHFRLAKKLRRAGIPVIYFIPPKIWAWRKSRIKILRERFVKVLSIFPFEVPFYQQEQMPVSYVGNPLVDSLPLSLTREQAREKLGIPASQPTFLLMPGSRPAELKYHFDIMLDAVALVSERLGKKIVVLVPLPLTSDLAEVQRRAGAWISRKAGLKISLSNLDLRVSQGNAPECMVAADAGIIKSGTSTLEAGILGCIHSIMYRSNRLTHFIFHMFIRYYGPVGLVNLVAGWKLGEPFLIREVLHHSQNGELWAQELLSLYQDQERRKKLSEGLLRVRQSILSVGASPSEQAALEILEVVRTCRRP